MSAVGGPELELVPPGERPTPRLIWSTHCSPAGAQIRLPGCWRRVRWPRRARAQTGPRSPRAPSATAVLLAQESAQAAAEGAAEVVRAGSNRAPVTVARAQLLQGKALVAARDRACPSRRCSWPRISV